MVIILSVQLNSFKASNFKLLIFSEEQYPYIHRISYLWNIVLASATGMLCGYFTSWYSRKFFKILPPNDPDLFSPPVSAWLQKHKYFHDNKGDEVVIFEKVVRFEKKEPVVKKEDHTS